jgi:hypothetical protein
MDNTKDGGPAFPSLARDGNWQPHHDGMSLRDYFAAKAIQGLLANNANYGTDDGLARDAYEFADAMLRARAIVAEVQRTEPAAQSPADIQRAHLETFGK